MMFLVMLMMFSLSFHPSSQYDHNGGVANNILLDGDSQQGNVLFPPWECGIPSVGTNHSQRGNGTEPIDGNTLTGYIRCCEGGENGYIHRIFFLLQI